MANELMASDDHPLMGSDTHVDGGAGTTILLRGFGLLLFVGGTTYVALLAIFGPDALKRPAPYFAIVIGMVVLWLVRRQRLNHAALLLCWGFLGVAVIANYLVLGLLNPTWTFVPIAVMLGGWLLTRTQAAVLTTVSFISVLGVLALTVQGHQFMPMVSVTNGALTIMAAVLIAAVLGYATAQGFRRQLAQVAELAKSLQQANLTLEQRVLERTAELEATVEQLKRTQNELIEHEKLASLGALVAGISHEINTPIGNALTVASTLDDQFSEITEARDHGRPVHEQVEVLLSNGTQMARFVVKSVRRAADLVSSFKQVAVDQTSERRRRFDLRELIDDNLVAMGPFLRQRKIVVETDVPLGIECDSFPGPLGQIVTNLIQNACVHGFPTGGGQVSIVARMDAERVALTVTDNGAGIQPELLGRIFDPFFTTRLGRGGSGLGLSICRRIAGTVLGGQLTVKSEAGLGTEFTLAMPCCLPYSS